MVCSITASVLEEFNKFKQHDILIKATYIIMYMCNVLCMYVHLTAV